MDVVASVNTSFGRRVSEKTESLLKFFSEYGVLILWDTGGGGGGARREMDREGGREREGEREGGPDSWVLTCMRGGESKTKLPKRPLQNIAVCSTQHTHTHTHTHTHMRATYTYYILSEAIMPNPKAAMCQSKP